MRNAKDISTVLLHFSVASLVATLLSNLPTSETAFAATDPVFPAETVAAPGAPNTSASRSFAGSSNGNLGGMTSVSKVNVHSLLYAGHTTKVLAHYLPWWGGPWHRGVDVGYSSNDPIQAFLTFSDMHSRGIDGVIVDWYGQNNYIDTAWSNSMSALARFPDLSFAIMVDAGTFRESNPTQADITTRLLTELNYISRQYLTSRQYLRFNGRPVIYEFGMDTVGKVDWDLVQKTYPDLSWVHIHKQGFDLNASAGAFVWIDAPAASTNPKTANLANVSEFYRYARTEPTKIAVAGTFKGFDDALAPWATTRHLMPQVCGQTWLQSFALVNQYFDAVHQLPFVQLITWNDYEEGTALETGIDTCTTVSALASESRITVTLTHPETVDHLQLYTKNASGTLTSVASYPAQSGTLPVFPDTTQTYVVEAVGKPFLRNVMSSPVSFK